MDDQTRINIIMCDDPDEIAQEEKAHRQYSDEQKESLGRLQEEIHKDIERVLDLSYYRLGNQGLKAIVPYLETEYFISVRELNLAYNNLTDDGVDAVIQSLAGMGSQIELINLSGNKISDGEIKVLADHMKHKLKKLGTVILEDVELSKEAENILKLAKAKVKNRAPALGDKYEMLKYDIMKEVK